MSDIATTVVIVGHVDHGKSTFIGRLLYDTNNISADRLADMEKASKEQGRRLEFAFAMDQFQEEREANITIDTTQTQIKLNDRSFLLVDAPGHKEYLRNMITGATQAKNAFLLLDVKEGLREQTAKHARVLRMLNIPNVAVLINKMDLVNHDKATFEKAKADVTALLKEAGLTPAAVIPIAAYDGDNVANRSTKMNWYAGPTAIEFLKSLPVTEEHVPTSAPFYFPVQLLHTVDGRSLLLGRVEQGVMRAGERAVLFPSKEVVGIRRVEKYKEDLKEAGAGECVAVELNAPSAAKRGAILCAPVMKIDAAKKLGVQSVWLSEDKLKVGDRIQVDCRTQLANAKVAAIKDEWGAESVGSLTNGDLAVLELTVEEPFLADVPSRTEALSRIVFHKNGNAAGCGVVTHVEI